MNNSVDISVIIPVYNSEATIVESVISVVSSIKHEKLAFELILINDGSTDGSLEQILKLQKFDPGRIIVIDQENSGAASARNAGLDIATGKLIAFNDADDRWTDSGLGLRLSVLDALPQLVCLAANHDIETQPLYYLKKLLGNCHEVTLFTQMFKNYFAPPTVILRRIVVDEGLRFDPSLSHAEEGYFFNHVASRYECGILNRKVSESITGKKRYGESGLSGNLSLMQAGEIRNLRNAYEELHKNKLLYLIALVFSKLKYVKRISVVFIRRFM